LGVLTRMLRYTMFTFCLRDIRIAYGLMVMEQGLAAPDID